MDKQHLDQFIDNIAKTGVNSLSMLGYASLPPQFRADLQARVQHQEDVLKVMTVLPSKHRYDQVEAAIEASDVPPRSIYESLAANNNTLALARFYEALNGPGVHAMKFNYIEEIAPLTKEQEVTPLTKEQWDWLINYVRISYGQHHIQGLIEMERFQSSMDKIQKLAGYSQEHIGEVSQALLDMAGIDRSMTEKESNDSL